MKKGLMNNWGLKILSFLLAVMLWLILLIIFAMWAVPQYVGQPLAGL